MLLFSGLTILAYQNCQRGFSTNASNGQQQSNNQIPSSNSTTGGVTSALASASSVSKNDLAQKPYMGFNTYYSSRIHAWSLTKEKITQVADDMKNYGLIDSGYNLLSLDVGWWFSWTGTPRDTTTNLIIPAPFIGNDSDMSSLVSHIHSDGLKVGLYTDTGSTGCGGFPGSGSYIHQDLQQMISWDVDMLMVDHCGGNVNAKKAGVVTAAYNGSDYEYSMWSSNIMNLAQTTGKQIVFNVCDWNFNDRTTGWAPGIANSWRTQTDIDYRVYNYNSVTGLWDIYDAASSTPISWQIILRNFIGNDVPPAAGPGHWNDPDYILIGGYGLTPTEEQSYFSMWVIQSAPLLLATYPADMAPTANDGPRLRAMLLNPEVIAINQDSLGRQAEKVREDKPGQVVYAKALSGNGHHAVLLLNENDVLASSITVNWGDLGLTSASSATVRDAVARQDLGTYSTSFTATNIPAHGSRLLVIQGTDLSINNGSWQSLSTKKVLGSPAVAVNSSGEADVALGLDRYYWLRTKSGSIATDWTRIKPAGCTKDVVFFNDPAITYVANGALDIVGLGYVDADGAGPKSVEAFFSYSFDNGKSWACFESLGKPTGSMLNGRLALVTSDGSTIDVLGRNNENSISAKRWTPIGGWTDWKYDGGCVRSGVSASSRSNGIVALIIALFSPYMRGCTE